MKKTAAAFCAVVLTLSACGNGGGGDQSDDSSAAEASANLEAAMLEDGSTLVGDAEPTETEATCISEGLVEEVGVETLQEQEVLDDNAAVTEDADLTAVEGEGADTITSVVEDCQARENIRSAVLEEGGSGLTGGTKPTEEQAQCISDGMVDDVGVETLKEYELLDEQLEINPQASPTDMAAEDADALAEVFVDCIDVEELFTSQFASAEQKLTAEQQECLTEAIDEDAMKAGLSASFQGKEDSGFADMQEEMMACVVPDMGGGGGE